MKKGLKKLSLFLGLIFVVEAACGHNTIKASYDQYSTVKGNYSDWLLKGVNLVQTPIADKNDVKRIPILDKSKLEDLKGNDWFNSLPGNQSFTYQTITGKTQYDLDKKLSVILGVKKTADKDSLTWFGGAGFSTDVTIKKNEARTENKYYGKIVADCLYEKCTNSLDLDDLEKCLSDSFVKAVKKGDYNYVFENYGTHLIAEASIGGRLVVTFNTRDNKVVTEDQLIIDATESYKQFSSNQTVDNYQKVTNFEKNCEYSIDGVGGDPTSLPGKIDENNTYNQWMGTVRDNAAMYQANDFIPVWKLFEDKTIQKNMEIAYYKYFNSYLDNKKDEIPFVTDMRVSLRNDPNVGAELQSNEIVTKTDASRNYEISDLNRHCHGKYIYMIYKTGTDKSQKITDVIINCLSKGTSVPAKAGYIHVPGDLNCGSGGKYIYFNYKRDASAVGENGYQGFCTRQDNTVRGDNWVPIKDVNGNIMDLNKGCGGDYIYLFGYKDPYIAQINNQIAANNTAIRKIELSNGTSTQTTTRLTTDNTTKVITKTTDDQIQKLPVEKLPFNATKDKSTQDKIVLDKFKLEDANVISLY